MNSLDICGVNIKFYYQQHFRSQPLVSHFVRKKKNKQENHSMKESPREMMQGEAPISPRKQNDFPPEREHHGS